MGWNAAHAQRLLHDMAYADLHSYLKDHLDRHAWGVADFIHNPTSHRRSTKKGGEAERAGCAQRLPMDALLLYMDVRNGLRGGAKCGEGCGAVLTTRTMQEIMIRALLLLLRTWQDATSAVLAFGREDVLAVPAWIHAKIVAWLVPHLRCVDTKGMPEALRLARVKEGLRAVVASIDYAALPLPAWPQFVSQSILPGTNTLYFGNVTPTMMAAARGNPKIAVVREGATTSFFGVIDRLDSWATFLKADFCLHMDASGAGRGADGSTLADVARAAHCSTTPQKVVLV